MRHRLGSRDRVRDPGRRPIRLSGIVSKNTNKERDERGRTEIMFHPGRPFVIIINSWFLFFIYRKDGTSD
jgi:hypothetical protein